MIDPGMVLLVRRLLADGKLSQREIARHTGVSRITIAGIASGRRPDYAARCEARQRESEAFEPVGPPQRCPGCGGYVFMPCLLCRVRSSNRAPATKGVRPQGGRSVGQALA